MKNILNILHIIVITTFFFTVYKYYSSNKNIEAKNYIRNNIDEIINKKITNLPILENDTDNLIMDFQIKLRVKNLEVFGIY